MHVAAPLCYLFFVPLASAISRSARIVSIAAALSGIAAPAEIRVYSELSRIGPDGEVVASDRGSAKPREILSPAIARNAYASYQLFVDVKPDQKWTLYVGQNPDKAIGVKLFREVFIKGVPVYLEGETDG